MEFNEFRIKAKQIEDDFIESGLNYKAVVDKITIDLFDEIEEWIVSKLHQPTVISAVCECDPLEANFNYDDIPCDWCTNCGNKKQTDL